MNITLPAGRYPLYQKERGGGIILELREDFILRCGEVWLLTGDNGLGKSSFVRRTLLPAARSENGDSPLVCWFEQDFQLQCEAIRARAAALGKPIPANEESAMTALLDDFAAAAGEEREVLYLFDEAEMYAAIPGLDTRLAPRHTLLLISHSDDTLARYPQARRLNFTAQGGGVSLLKEDHVRP